MQDPAWSGAAPPQQPTPPFEAAGGHHSVQLAGCPTGSQFCEPVAGGSGASTTVSCDEEDDHHGHHRLRLMSRIDKAEAQRRSLQIAMGLSDALLPLGPSSPAASMASLSLSFSRMSMPSFGGVASARGQADLSGSGPQPQQPLDPFAYLMVAGSPR